MIASTCVCRRVCLRSIGQPAECERRRAYRWSWQGRSRPRAVSPGIARSHPRWREGSDPPGGARATACIGAGAGSEWVFRSVRAVDAVGVVAVSLEPAIAGRTERCLPEQLEDGQRRAVAAATLLHDEPGQDAAFDPHRCVRSILLNGHVHGASTSPHEQRRGPPTGKAQDGACSAHQAAGTHSPAGFRGGMLEECT